MGLSQDEFYALTPRQFHLLVDQHLERVEHQELLAGIIAAEVGNGGVRAPKKPLVPADFMPCKRNVKRRSSTPRTNRKQVAQDIRDWVDQMRVAGKVETVNG